MENISIEDGDVITIRDNSLHNIRKSSQILTGLAGNFIPANYCVSISGGMDAIVAATNTDINKDCNGISIRQSSKTELVQFIRNGIITSDDLSFSAPPLSPVYLGKDGELVTDVPTKGVLQKVGYVLSENSMLIKIENSIELV